ncbi:hypothetical protein RSOLAG1IB_11172 [Rhizoctonia solani AG-1 IB]|nr:hypothetical protein RSOLAG1IB_11172 [Rhizoctonia solani AG-1 IB]
MGHVQGSKRRNRLHYDKVHDLATVRMDLKRQHQVAGLIRKRARRHFNSTSFEATSLLHQSSPEIASGSVSDSEASDDEDDSDVPVDLKILAARLADATVDDEDEDHPEAPEAVGSTECQGPRVRLFFGTAHPIPLRDVFKFAEVNNNVNDNGLGVFWEDGVRILSKERKVYECISSESVPE